MRRNRYWVYTSFDIRLVHWLQRYFPPGYALADNDRIEPDDFENLIDEQAATPGDFAISREWGVPTQDDEPRWMWSTIARHDGLVMGTFGNHPAAGPEQHTAMLAIYRGAIAVNRSGLRFADESKVDMVNGIKVLGAASELEELLKGLVPSEIYARAHMEALKAQAVDAFLREAAHRQRRALDRPGAGP